MQVQEEEAVAPGASFMSKSPCSFLSIRFASRSSIVARANVIPGKQCGPHQLAGVGFRLSAVFVVTGELFFISKIRETRAATNIYGGIYLGFLHFSLSFSSSPIHVNYLHVSLYILILYTDTYLTSNLYLQPRFIIIIFNQHINIIQLTYFVFSPVSPICVERLYAIFLRFQIKSDKSI